jgi:ribosomal protein S10
MILNITLVSKNKQTFTSFLKIFNIFYQKNQMLNVSLISQKKKKKEKKVFSVLKSPHVNKKSKQKFQHVEHGLNLKLQIFDKKKFLLVLKLLKLNVFSDLKIKIKTELKSDKLSKFSKMNPNLFKFKYIKDLNNNLNIFDCYGENLFSLKKPIKFK